MLDNLGLGEIFFLALLALLFFGPERLPQIGAQLGRWIRNLTQYSSAFLNEWREEALVVRDAVQEVKGIRDEIVAARAEIAGTLNTARADVGDAVTGATRDVQEQIVRSTQMLPEAQTPPKAPAAAETGTDAAIAKTQAIVDGLKENPLPLRPPPSSATGEGKTGRSLVSAEEWRDWSTPLRTQSRRAGESASSEPETRPVETPQRHPTPVGERSAEASASVSPPLPQAPVQAAQIEGLHAQVDLLRREMHALQAELAQVRARIEARAARSEGAGRAEPEAPLAPASSTIEPTPEPGGEAT